MCVFKSGEKWRNSNFPKKRKPPAPKSCLGFELGSQVAAFTSASARSAQHRPPVFLPDDLLPDDSDDALCSAGGRARMLSSGRLHRKLGRLPPEPQRAEFRCQGLGTKNMKCICNGQMHGGRSACGVCPITHQNLPEEIGAPGANQPTTAQSQGTLCFSTCKSSLHSPPLEGWKEKGRFPFGSPRVPVIPGSTHIAQSKGLCRPLRG